MAAELVTITVDGVEIQVPKGTNVVEAAAQGGIEIPVFCYEPRLGAPVGACRMCLCEVEGTPKPQATCTMGATDGLVVKTAATSQQAADAQQGTLEFILLNHPLDCPVCDKGGECPLQDLTFRYGPGNTRMTFPKRTFDKPIPVSPLIALDRERCILCYRCTRFSEGVAEDGQLVAVNRGANSVIATFEDEPYRAPFSGNVVELCPVGALTSTQYRFQARPWDIQNVPSVCGLCPVGCNTSVTIRENRAKRIQSRNHPEVDQGWLCDKGRFSAGHLEARDRITAPLRRKRRMGLEQIDWDTALDGAEALIRGASGRVVTALSGTETVELAYALARLLREGVGSSAAVLPEETSDALDPFRLPLSAIAQAELIVVVGDDPVVERAPIVDLWLRQARRAGAQIVTIGPAGSLQAGPGTAAASCERLAGERDELGQRLRACERAILIWSGPGGHGGATLAALAAELGFHDRPGCGAFHLPATPNGRGVAEAWAAASDRENEGGEPIGLLIVSGDEAASDPNVRHLAEHAERVIAITLFHGLAVGWADLVLPATSYLERDGSLVNLEGRVQRLRRAVTPPVPDEIEWISNLGARFGVEISPHPAVLFDELSPTVLAGVAHGHSGDRAPLAPRLPLAGVPAAPAPEPAPPAAGGGSLQLVHYRALFSGPVVERIPELQFQRPAAEVELAAADAARLGVATGDRVTVGANGLTATLAVRVNRRLLAGTARAAEEHVRELADVVDVTREAGA